MVITKEFDLEELVKNLEELVKNLEELNHLLLYKNRNFVRKHLSKIINDLKNSQNDNYAKKKV